MQHITKKTKVRRRRGLTEILIFSITTPGWKRSMDFEEYGMEIAPQKLACPQYGCKVYRHKDGTLVVWHNNTYGCPRG